MKNAFILSFVLFTTLLSAQNTITWKGGTPGNENSWSEARNWNENMVPDEDSHVIIKFTNSGHYAQPVIKGTVQVAWIELYRKASLTIPENATLIIDGAMTYSEGLSMKGGTLVEKGELIVKNIEMEPDYFSKQNTATAYEVAEETQH